MFPTIRGSAKATIWLMMDPLVISLVPPRLRMPIFTHLHPQDFMI